MALMRVDKSFDIYVTKEQLEEYLMSAGVEEGMILPHQSVSIIGIEIDPSTFRLTVDANIFQREDA
jgi:hypothetical protein